MPKVIYLTGAPAAGKSSTAEKLTARVSNLVVWEYGAELTRYVNGRTQRALQQTDVRAQSSGVVSPGDVATVDDELLSFVSANRATSHVLIDSHPVTKEEYGYRITSFSSQQVIQLEPDEIWVLYTSPEVTQQRIASDDGGRPTVTEEQARMHTMLQASVASTYGILTGSPVYLFDSAGPQSELVTRLAARLT